MAWRATNWTGAAVVNGLMAIVLLAWLADSPAPVRRTATPAPDRAAERNPDRPIEALASIDLPPPPASRHATAARPVSPMRPSTNRPAERAIEIVALRAAVAKPRPARPPVAVALEPAKQPEPAPEPDVSPAPDISPAKAEFEVDAEKVRDGRQLLRILEHGDGPGIEIAWPGGRAERERLHGVLRRCFGMRLALLDRSGALYLEAGQRGRRWPIDLDRYSGFVRRPNGRITRAERRDAGRIARYHRGLPVTDPVRLFPRVADAALLGGLAHLLGDGYRSSKAITASYRLRGLRLTVEGVRVDGRSVPGRIDLTPAASGACRS